MSESELSMNTAHSNSTHGTNTGDGNQNSNINSNFNSNFNNDDPQTPKPAARVMDAPSSNSTAGTCFFADATLDLEEAHGLADMTPELYSKCKTINFDSVQTYGDDGDAGVNSDENGVEGGVMLGRSKEGTTTIFGGRRAESAEALLVLPSLQEQDNNKVNGNRSMKQVTSNSINNTQNDTDNPSNLPTYRPRAPRYPRDILWTIVFAIVLPLTLILPIKIPIKQANTDTYHTNIENWTTSLSNNATLLFTTTTILLLSTLLLARTLYLSRGGGDGDDARFRASNLLLVASSLTWLPFAVLGLQVYWMEAHDDDGDGKLEGKALLRILTLGLFGVSLWELFVFSNWIYDSSGTLSSSANNGRRDHRHSALSVRALMMVGSTSNRLWNGRKMAFFRELASTSLDILSRSLRCQSFYRVVCLLVLVQFLLVWMWHNALVRVMRRVGADGGGWEGTWMVAICAVGWWGSSVVRRVLGLIASGGITSWFAQQSLLLEEMERMKVGVEKDDQPSLSSGLAGRGGGNGGNVKHFHPTMPEAYRVDASAYSSAIEFDEGIDDDYEDDEDLYGGSNTSRMDDLDKFIDVSLGRKKGNTEWTGGGSGGASTVKAFLVSAVTVSLGSVVKCALMGGLAQVIWWVCHKVDNVKLLSARYIRSGFQGMSIGNIGGVNASRRDRLKERLAEMYTKLDAAARTFVRNNSELALCHVAAYFKSYRRAANDVMALLDASGVEPILHQDLSSHMCSAISKSISATLTIFIGQILLYRRTGEGSDVVICETMIISYIMCYTILFTVMEPLRASISAVYVCFAQHPQSLSQAFPLVYHRLSRISEDNAV